MHTRSRIAFRPAAAAAALSLALVLAGAGCSDDEPAAAKPLTLLYTGAVGGKVEPCG